jgi:hypothetical protein
LKVQINNRSCVVPTQLQCSRSNLFTYWFGLDKTSVRAFHRSFTTLLLLQIEPNFQPVAFSLIHCSGPLSFCNFSGDEQLRPTELGPRVTSWPRACAQCRNQWDEQMVKLNRILTVWIGGWYFYLLKLDLCLFIEING